jgi:hypothetical protein
MYYFYGVIGCEEKRGADFGRMEDLIGKSKIFVFTISRDRLTFEKQYEHMIPGIFIHFEYEFIKEGGLWKGFCVMSNGDMWPTNCFVIETPPDFFEPSETVLREMNKRYIQKKEF